MYKEEKSFSSTKISHKAKTLYPHATIWRLCARRIQSLLTHDILPYTEFFRHPTLDFTLANRKIRQLTTFTHDTIGSLLAIPSRYLFLFSNTRKVEIHSLSESWDLSSTHNRVLANQVNYLLGT